MSDTVWLLLWLGVAGYVATLVVAAVISVTMFGVCAIWRRLRRLMSR